MNTQSANKLRKNSIVTAIGILVLVIGTATGSAYAMLAMAAVGLTLIAISYRQELGWNELWLMAVAAVTASAIAIFLSMS